MKENELLVKKVNEFKDGLLILIKMIRLILEKNK